MVFNDIKVLQSIETHKSSSQTLALLVSEFLYTYETAPIQALIEDLRHHDEVRAIGVVNEKGQMSGILIRRHLSTLMLKPYAQDILKKRSVRQIMSSTRIFSLNDSIFVVAEQIKEELLMDEVQYFLVSDNDRSFGGIFSTLDILNYMSHLMQQDVALAGRLQKRIVKERELVVSNSFEYISSNQTAKGVGGDFTSIKRISGDKWLIALCDVSGKGIAASVITSVLWGMMSIYDFKNGMKEFIRNLNNYLVKTFEAEKFITGLFIELNESKYELKLCDMGHSHLFLLRKNKLHALETPEGNLPIGIMPDIEPKIHRLKYLPGDLVFLMTDGLIEQENMEKQVYNMERVETILSANPGAAVEVLHDLITRDFKKFRADQILNDDVSMTLIRFAEQEVVIE
jgi:sigma-B regulation protein RsbU (phosphoserine phosphatase)